MAPRLCDRVNAQGTAFALNQGSGRMTRKEQQMMIAVLIKEVPDTFPELWVQTNCDFSSDVCIAETDRGDSLRAGGEVSGPLRRRANVHGCWPTSRSESHFDKYAREICETPGSLLLI